MEDFRKVAIIYVFCGYFDQTDTNFNPFSYTYKELIEEELSNLKDFLAYTLLNLTEYKQMYLETYPELVPTIQEAINILLVSINNSLPKRKRRKYTKVVKILQKYKSDFFEEDLSKLSEKEIDTYIKEYILEHTGELICQIDKIRNELPKESEKSKDLWKVFSKLVDIVNETGEQKDIVLDEDLQKSRNEKFLGSIHNALD